MRHVLETSSLDWQTTSGQELGPAVLRMSADL
jgi:hypothetical protein